MSRYVNKPIITERLILDRYSERDLDRVAYALGNEYICKNIGANPIKDIDRVKEYIEDNKITFDSKKCRSTRIAVRLKNRKFIGNIGVYKREDHIELGWWLLNDYRHEGYMSEAIKELITHLKSFDKCLKIKANIYKFNRESQSLAERVGMRLVKFYNDTNIYIEYEI